MNFEGRISVCSTSYGLPESNITSLEWQYIRAINQVGFSTKEGANKQVISSQADSLIKISRIWADFFPANTSNQPI
ncbi:hypothetical protein ACN83_23945 [Escherichia coli]|nr:hypothetical protein ACN83_23945 [Escherichia coli]